MQSYRKGWQAVLAVSTAVCIVPALAYGQSRGTGPYGAGSGYFSGSAATGHHGTCGSFDTPQSLTESEEETKSGQPEAVGRTATDRDFVVLQRIQESIRTDPGLANYGQAVTVKISDGEVALTGSVPTEKVKADFGSKVQQVPGVKVVHNQLQVAPNLSGTTSGTEPQSHQTDSSLDLGRLSSPADTLFSFFTAAAYAAEEESFPPTGSKGAAATDDEQLPGSGSMHETDRTSTTGPSGSRNTAIDSGPVNPEARVAKSAGDYAVTDVDRELAARVRLALADPQLRVTEDNVHLVVDNGEVTIYGWVQTEQAKRAISERVREQRGVQDVDNRLRIASGGSPLSENR